MENTWIDKFIKLVCFLQAIVWICKALIWVCKKLSKLIESVWKKIQEAIKEVNWAWNKNIQYISISYPANVNDINNIVRLQKHSNEDLNKYLLYQEISRDYKDDEGLDKNEEEDNIYLSLKDNIWAGWWWVKNEPCLDCAPENCRGYCSL